MMSEEERVNKHGKVVCVTGASGFIGSWLVKLLLQRDYTVHATVRDLDDPEEVDHLKELEGAKERLHLFEAELLEEGSFDAAISGCNGVFHVASPVNFNVKDPQKWYSVSKLLAEEAAWKFAKENDLDLVTMNPGMVIGPMLPPKPNVTMAIIFNMINGAQSYQNVAFPWVHIHNVAEAHIGAFELPSANGRYCLVESVVHQSKLVELLNELYPSVQLPNKCADDGPLAETYQVSKAKAESLGIQYISLRDNLKDAVESLKEKKLISAA